MGRTTWVKPMTLVQEFEANEAVAATQCWRVKCDRKLTYSWWDGSLLRTETHNPCRNIDNQWLYDEDGDGKPDKMIELGHDRECTIYADENYTQLLPLGEIDPTSGMTIYWTNKLTDHTLVVYHHKGTIQQASEEHPNRS